VEAASTAVLALLLGHFWLPSILALVALDGAGALCASALLRTAAARAGATRGMDTVREPGAGGEREESSPRRDAYDANAALNVALSVTVVAGPAIAAVVVRVAGGPAALLLDAVSFLACGALLVDLHPYVEESSEESSVRGRLAAAWEHLRQVPALRALLLTEALALVFFETGAPVEVLYAKSTLRAGDIGYGALLAMWGLGMVLGSLVFARSKGRSLAALLSAGTLAVGLAYVGFALAPTLGLAMPAAVLGGIGNGVQWASLIGAVQRMTPERLHGRLMGAVESIGALCPLVGVPLSGLVVTLSSPRVAFFAFGLGAAAVTCGFVRLWAGGQVGSVQPGEVRAREPVTGSAGVLEPAMEQLASTAYTGPGGVSDGNL
jgi:predicted MFS family arabinose efflux permease